MCLINTSINAFNNVFTLNTSGGNTNELVFKLLFSVPLRMCLFKNTLKGINTLNKQMGRNSHVWAD